MLVAVMRFTPSRQVELDNDSRLSDVELEGQELVLQEPTQTHDYRSALDFLMPLAHRG